MKKQIAKDLEKHHLLEIELKNQFRATIDALYKKLRSTRTQTKTITELFTKLFKPFQTPSLMAKNVWWYNPVDIDNGRLAVKLLQHPKTSENIKQHIRLTLVHLVSSLGTGDDGVDVVDGDDIDDIDDIDGIDGIDGIDDIEFIDNIIKKYIVSC